MSVLTVAMLVDKRELTVLLVLLCFELLEESVGAQRVLAESTLRVGCSPWLFSGWGALLLQRGSESAPGTQGLPSWGLTSPWGVCLWRGRVPGLGERE